MRHLNKGQLLTQEELYEIANCYNISKHAHNRMAERNLTDDMVRLIILSPMIAYFNTDYTINIAFNKYNYFVVDYNNEEKCYNIITYKEKSKNNIDIFKKWNMAKSGYSRK